MSCRKAIVALIALVSLAALSGCSKSPTGVSLHDAVAKTMPVTDGNWAGLTDQSKDIHFSVLNKGTKVNSGLQFTLAVQEASGDIMFTTLVWMDVADQSFQFSNSGVSIAGRFTSPERCTGTYHVIGYVNGTIPIDYSGSWNASWVSN